MANHKNTPSRPKKPAAPKKKLKEPIPIDSASSLQQTSSTAIISSDNIIHQDDVPVVQSYPDMDIEEEIRRRAYELYEERGCQQGFHHEDWVRAEAEIMIRYTQQTKKERSA